MATNWLRQASTGPRLIGMRSVEGSASGSQWARRPNWERYVIADTVHLGQLVPHASTGPGAFSPLWLRRTMRGCEIEAQHDRCQTSALAKAPHS
jgi:hypothetical protein